MICVFGTWLIALANQQIHCTLHDQSTRCATAAPRYHGYIIILWHTRIAHTHTHTIGICERVLHANLLKFDVIKADMLCVAEAVPYRIPEIYPKRKLCAVWLGGFNE